MKYNKSNNTWIIEIHDADLVLLRECLKYSIRKMGSECSFYDVNDVNTETISRIGKLLEIFKK